MHPAVAPIRLPSAALLLALVLACGGGAAKNTGATGDTGESTTHATGTDSTTGDAGSTTGTSTGGASTAGTTVTTGNDATRGTTESTGAATTDPATTGAISSSSTGTTGTSTSTASTDSTSTTGTTSGTDGTTTGSGSGDSTTGGGELGVLSGDCGLIDAMELTSPEPFVFSGAIDFGVVGFDYDLLTPGGQEIHDDGNLNPGSLHSEIVAYEVLARCDQAVLLKTEGEIVYQDPMGKKTDFLAELDGLKVGVSVVRAVGFPFDAPYTVQQAEAILTDKLGDILVSSQNVAPEDAWVKQILSVVAYGPMHRDSLLAAYAGLSPMLTADTIVVITVTDGDDAFIY